MLTNPSITLDASIGRPRSLSTSTPTVVSIPVSPKLPIVSVNGQKLPVGGKTEASGQLQKAVRDISTYVQNLQRDLQFRVDKTLGVTIISVVDSETKEVVRQIISEQAIESAQPLQELKEPDYPAGSLLFRAQI